MPNWRDKTSIISSDPALGEGSFMKYFSNGESQHCSHIFLPFEDNPSNEEAIGLLIKRINVTLYRMLVCTLTPEVALGKYQLEGHAVTKLEIASLCADTEPLILYVYINAITVASRHMLKHGMVTPLDLEPYKKLSRDIANIHGITLG